MELDEKIIMDAAKDMKKPMVYIILKDGREGFRADMFTDTLIGTINNYGDSKDEMGKTAIYLQAFMSSYIKLEDDSDKITSKQSTKKIQIIISDFVLREDPYFFFGPVQLLLH